MTGFGVCEHLEDRPWLHINQKFQVIFWCSKLKKYVRKAECRHACPHRQMPEDRKEK